ncbi:MAG: NADH-quinone oxidoreductase subunit M, partial [Paraburkholderia sp.]|nr:NADH-quinone oxidoreductase subunit M [Paraburkholderia sp.]
GGRELALLGAMAVLVLAIGLYPKPFTDAIDPTVGNLMAQAERGDHPEQPAPEETTVGLRANVPATAAPRLPG